MTDLRILIAKALNSSDLEHSEFRETDVDRIGLKCLIEHLKALSR